MPNTKEKFINSLKRGTGEAVLILKNNPKLDFSAEIIKAAIKNYTPNVQDEGTRSQYIFDLIKLSPNQPKIKAAILKGLSEEKNNSDTLDQLFGIAYLFAKQGDEEFHKVIYKRYFKNTIDGADFLGEDEILKLDGIDGLKFIAEIRGKNFIKNPNYIEDGSIINFFQKENPKINVQHELKSASKTNLFIRKYINTIQSYKNPVFKKEKIKISSKLVEKRINQNRVVPINANEVKKLSKSETLKIADNFLKETQRIRKEKYLRIFSIIKFPYNYDFLLNEAKRKYNDTDRLVEFACDSLKFFKHKDIRDFGLKQFRIAKFPSIYISLLIANYKKGDGKILAKLIKNEKRQWKIHSLAMNLIDLYEKNKTKDCKEPLVKLYSKLTCGYCRYKIVRILIKNDVLPLNIKAEIQHDSYEKTQKLYNKIK